MKKYYCYAYSREDGTPYYIGKGTGKRINSKIHNVNLSTVPVFVVELNKIFLSIKEASFATEADQSQISKCLWGEAKSSKGYHFIRVN